MNAPLVPLVNATRFRQAHAADWERLDELVTRLEKRSIRVLSDDDLLELPALYRITLSSLSVARDTSLDQALITYLEQLSTRAYFQIYGVQTPAHRQIARFFASSWPEAVRAMWRETLFCVVLTFGAALVAYLLIRGDPSWFYSIIPAGLAGGRDPAASAEFLRSTLYDPQKDWLGVFATFLFTHNAQIAIFAFALGFAFAVPTLLLIIYNGLMLGRLPRRVHGQGTWPERRRLADDSRDDGDFRDLHLRCGGNSDRNGDRLPRPAVANGFGCSSRADGGDRHGGNGHHAGGGGPARGRRPANHH